MPPIAVIDLRQSVQLRTCILTRISPGLSEPLGLESRIGEGWVAPPCYRTSWLCLVASLSVLQGDMLEMMSVRNTAQLEKIIPNMTAHSDRPSQSFPSLRGAWLVTLYSLQANVPAGWLARCAAFDEHQNRSLRRNFHHTHVIERRTVVLTAKMRSGWRTSSTPCHSVARLAPGLAELVCTAVRRHMGHLCTSTCEVPGLAGRTRISFSIPCTDSSFEARPALAD